MFINLILSELPPAAGPDGGQAAQPRTEDAQHAWHSKHGGPALTKVIENTISMHDSKHDGPALTKGLEPSTNVIEYAIAYIAFQA